MIEDAKKLFDSIVNKIGSSSSARVLNSGASSGHSPSKPSLVEAQNEIYLALRTGSAESKGMLTGFGFLVGGYGVVLFLLIIGFGNALSSDWWLLLCSILGILMPAAWECTRPPSLPIVFNRRTQEIYYDLKGELYHAVWEGIEAVAYEYRMVNQYSGSIVHGNLEIILQKFGDPRNRVALNLSGISAGKRLSTLVGIWEYLRCFMTIGPWFDETGRRTESRSRFIEETLESGQISFLDLILDSRTFLGQERKEGNGISGSTVIEWIGSYLLFPVALGMEFIQRVDRKRSRKHWPEVVQERLDPNGPTSRLIDIEEDYMAQKQKELDELHERMRKTLPR